MSFTREPPPPLTLGNPRNPLPLPRPRCRKDWLNRCIEEGKLLPDAPFRVVRSQKLGMGNFLDSSSSSSSSSASSDCRVGGKGLGNDAQKENKREEKSKRRRSFPGKTPGKNAGAVTDGRHGEKRRRDRSEVAEEGAGGKCGATAAAKLSNGYRDSSRRDVRGARVTTERNVPTRDRNLGHRSSNNGSSNKRRVSSKGESGSREGSRVVGDVDERKKRCTTGSSSMHDRSDSAEHGSGARTHRIRESTNSTVAATAASRRRGHAADAAAVEGAPSAAEEGNGALVIDCT